MHVIFVVDRSGSMSGKQVPMTEGIQKIVKENKKAKFSIVQFDHEVEVVARRKGGKSKDVKNYMLNPRGTTALYDGIGKALDLVDYSERTLVVIITDGLENSSSEWSNYHVRPLIAAMQASNIEFIFLGAGIDAFAEGGRLGITQGNNIKIMSNDSVGFDSAINFTSDVTSSFAMGSSVSASVSTLSEDGEYADTLAFEAPTEKAERRKGKSYGS